MFCNYENITDYCLNNFSYQYASLKNDGFFLSDDTSDNASVYRTDLTNGTTKLISLLSSDIVLGCDSNDDESNISEWNCYQIYRNLGESNISSAPLETYVEYQKKLVAESYSNVLDSGISISLREKNFILSAKIEDVIYYASLSSQAQYLYDNDPDNQMPSFFDKDGNTHTLSYSDLIFVLKIYLNKVIHYKNLIDNINRLIDNVETIDEINDLGWCDDKIISSLVEDTKIEDKEANPSVIEDLPQPNKDFSIPCRSYRLYRCTSIKALTATGYNCQEEILYDNENNLGSYCMKLDPDPYINNPSNYNLGSFNYLLSYTNNVYYLWGGGCYYQPGYNAFNPSPCLYDGLVVAYDSVNNSSPFLCDCDSGDYPPTE